MGAQCFVSRSGVCLTQNLAWEISAPKEEAFGQVAHVCVLLSRDFPILDVSNPAASASITPPPNHAKLSTKIKLLGIIMGLARL